jgi:hypothetical protein
MLTLDQILEHVRLSLIHFFNPGSVSGLIASTGHSGARTCAIDTLAGMYDKHVSSLVEASHGADFNAVH